MKTRVLKITEEEGDVYIIQEQRKLFFGLIKWWHEVVFPCREDRVCVQRYSDKEKAEKAAYKLSKIGDRKIIAEYE